MRGVTRDYLDPSKKLVDAVVDWLCDDRRTRLADGARSLAHLLVVVPTAQSGRSLRLALAKAACEKGWGGVLSPRVVQPMQLVKPADTALRIATDVEAAAAFQQYVKLNRGDVLELDRLFLPDQFDDLNARFALFDQLRDIWRSLAGRGLLMRDVPTIAGEALADDWGDERERWLQLSRLEKGYFDFLQSKGIVYPTDAVHRAKTQAEIVPPEIEEIVLPALADPVRVLGDVIAQQIEAGKKVDVLLHARPSDAWRFDELGWPKTEAWTGKSRPSLAGLKNEDIVCATNVSELARKVASDCPKVDSGMSLPTLALCDGDAFQGVSSSFLNLGYEVHNPERHLLVQSSLGRLIGNLISLYRGGDLPWRECLAVMRSSDLQPILGLDDEARKEMLVGADVAQNAFIPETIPNGFAFLREEVIVEWQRDSFNAFCEVGRRFEQFVSSAREGASLTQFLRSVLNAIFAGHSAGERHEEKEFAAAIDGARSFLDSLEGEVVSSLDMTDAEFESLARRALSAEVYSLEPDSPDVVRTEGWLELPWTDGDRVALVGFHEGKVPDSIVGHPFLPDVLRRSLGLTANDDRLARDSWILQELLDSHSEHAIRAYVARSDDSGDICRPSRLLYLCDDADLPQRVKTLFGDLPAERADRTRRIEWPLVLPDVVPLPKRFSASMLDEYVKCPFNYLLKCGLRMKVHKEKQELEANDFGTFIHDVLRQYALRQIERGDDQLTDAREIRRVLLNEIAPTARERFVKPTLNVALQLDAAEGRLSLFAERQAEWAQAGWRIREAECAIDYFVEEFGAGVRGSIDRVDENLNDRAARHWCVIDYKTWDESKLTGHVYTSDRVTRKNQRHLELAHALGFPTLRNKKGEERQRMLSVQLPFYGKAYAQSHPSAPFGDMEFRYFVLGKEAKQTKLSGALSKEQVDASVETARRAIKLIGNGVFWPLGPTDEWKRDYANLFVKDPVADIGGTDWAKRQAARLERTGV